MLQKHYKTITSSKIKSKTISKNKFTKLIKRPKKTMMKLMTKMNQSIQFHNEVSSAGCSNSPFRGHLTWHAFAGYLFVISNGSKSIKTNVLLDTGSGATFVTCDISQTRVCDMRYIIETRLKRGNTTNISFQCFIKQDTFTSKLVNSEISMSNPTSVR